MGRVGEEPIDQADQGTPGPPGVGAGRVHQTVVRCTGERPLQLGPFRKGHRHSDVEKRRECIAGFRRRQSAEHAAGVAFVFQAAFGQGVAHDGRPAVVVVHAGDLGVRPEALGHRERAGPDPRIDGPATDLFAPHAGFPAPDHARVPGVSRRRRVDGVVFLGRLDMIEVKPPGLNDGEPPGHGLTHGLLAAPGLHHGTGGEVAVHDLVPADHPAAVLRKNSGQAMIEPGLELRRPLHPASGHEGADPAIGPPIVGFDLIATDVPVGIRKERRHLADEGVEEAIDGFAGGIERGPEDAKAGLEAIGAGGAGEFGITDEPGGRVAGHVELGDHPDGTVRGVGHDLADLCLTVVTPGASLFVEIGKPAALDRETLIFGQVPVEHVQFGGGHALELPFDGSHGFEVAAHVEQQPAPGITRPVADLDRRDRQSRAVALGELKQGFQTVDRASRRGGQEVNSRSPYRQPVGLIGGPSQERDRRADHGDFHRNARDRNGPPQPDGEVIPEPVGRPIEAGLPISGEGQGISVADPDAAAPRFD